MLAPEFDRCQKSCGVGEVDETRANIDPLAASPKQVRETSSRHVRPAELNRVLAREMWSTQTNQVVHLWAH